MAYRLILHHDTLGVTQPALQALRNELAHRIDHNICVIEVPAVVERAFVGSPHDCETYGVFIVDESAGEVAIIGDGMRGDGGGEGGAGHRAVQALLAIYGVSADQALQEEAVNFVDDENAYAEAVKRIVLIAEGLGFSKLADKKPRYPDWVYARR